MLNKENIMQVLTHEEIEMVSGGTFLLTGLIFKLLSGHSNTPNINVQLPNIIKFPFTWNGSGCGCNR